MSRAGLRGIVATGLLLSVTAVAGCDSESDDTGTAEAPQTSALEDRGAAEASPELTEDATTSGELSDEDAAAVTVAVRGYIEALDRRDAEAVCALFEPGAFPISELPRRRGDCPASLAASIGYARPGGTPVWKRTTLEELNEVSVGPERARVTATVTHRFADRRFPSVEDDVIYLDRAGDRWLLAKPSGTLYRAVGYPEPPLRSLTPPN